MDKGILTQKAEHSARTPKTYRIPISTGLFPLCPKISEAIWLYAYYINRTTREGRNQKTGVIEGEVAGGNVLQDIEAAKALCVSGHTVRRWRERLEDNHLIRVKRTPLGFRIWVQNSQKWPGRTLERLKSDCPNLATQSKSDRPILQPQSGQICNPRVANFADPLKEEKSSTDQDRAAKQQIAGDALAGRTFQQAAKTYREIVHRSFGSLGSKKDEWGNLVSEHGPEVTLRSVELWIGELTGERAATFRNPVSVFLSQHLEYVAAAAAELQPHEPDPGAELVEVCGEIVPRATASFVREQHAEMDRRKREETEREIERRLDDALREKYGMEFPPPGPDYDSECADLRRKIEADFAGR